MLSPHRGALEIPNAFILNQVNQNVWGWDPGVGSCTKLAGDSNVVILLGFEAEIEWLGLRTLEGGHKQGTPLADAIYQAKGVTHSAHLSDHHH